MSTSSIAGQFPRTWQKSAVVYQIYPSSFLDSNGDGVGDLNGILSKLDYVRDLGTDVIWLGPVYTSPMADMGYDIADYENIDPKYGTLEDWDRLVAGVHARGMKLVMDLVVNHTSDEHAWFEESRSSKSNAKRDWYIWRPPTYDEHGVRKEPNNWRSIFQGSAWEWDEGTQEYYLHLFLSKQPDLNWENPELRQAIFKMMRFWIDRGCDGFRMDVINLISKVNGLPDAPVESEQQRYQWAGDYFVNGPRVHEYVREMNREALAKHDIFTVGEAPYSRSANDLAEYVLPGNRELQMVFQFEHVMIDQVGTSRLQPREWALPELKKIVNKWQNFRRADGFWNSVYIQNHDNAWSVSRFGNDNEKWRARSAKLLAMLEITQGGTLFVYQGEELGMKNSPKSWGMEEYKDAATINYYNRVKLEREAASGGKPINMTDVMDGIRKKARDHARRPMQWNGELHAGFTTGTPWMKVNDDYATWNAAAQLHDTDSVLAFWKKALRVRKTHDLLVYGDFHLLAPDDERVFAFTRTLNADAKALVVLNFSTETASFDAAQLLELKGRAKVVLCNHGEEGTTLEDVVKLDGYQGKIYIL